MSQPLQYSLYDEQQHPPKKIIKEIEHIKKNR